MVKTVTITNKYQNSLTFDVLNPATTGFVVKSIEGLGPVKSNINTSDYANIDGSAFNSSRKEPRNIVINLGIIGNKTYTVEDCRLILYKLLPTKTKIELRIITDKRDVKITGYVESNEIDSFSKEVEAQISILCPSPYFYDSLKNTVDLTYRGDMALLYAGINYIGDYETGLKIDMTFGKIVRNLNVLNYSYNEQIYISTSNMDIKGTIDFIAEDDLLIDTINREKEITLTRGNYTYNLLKYANPITWIKIYPGNNVIRISSQEYGALSSTTGTITYTNIYEAI